jgi:large conductance mechanosensitive channel
MLDEFKKFIFKGNIVDLSTGVIIGSAFTAIVSAFTKGIVEPILALFGGGPSPKLTIPIMERPVEVVKKAADGTEVKEMVNKLIELDLGGVVGATIQFLITAAVVFFLIIKPMSKVLAAMKKAEAEAPPAPPAADIVLLSEIRDLLKK